MTGRGRCSRGWLKPRDAQPVCSHRSLHVVVPAKAGTHNHRAVFLKHAVAPARKPIGICGYGSRSRCACPGRHRVCGFAIGDVKHAVSSPAKAKAGDPVFQRQQCSNREAAACWIARSSRAMTGEYEDVTSHSHLSSFRGSPTGRANAHPMTGSARTRNPSSRITCGEVDSGNDEGTFTPSRVPRPRSRSASSDWAALPRRRWCARDRAQGRTRRHRVRSSRRRRWRGSAVR